MNRSLVALVGLLALAGLALTPSQRRLRVGDGGEVPGSASPLGHVTAITAMAIVPTDIMGIRTATIVLTVTMATGLTPITVAMATVHTGEVIGDATTGAGIREPEFSDYLLVPVGSRPPQYQAY
jgi:hypothetical protein